MFKSLGFLTLMSAAFVSGFADRGDAATVTVGSLTIEDTAFADTSSLAAGNTSGTVPDNVLGPTFGSTSQFFTSLQTNTSSIDILEVGFTNNTLGNDAGADLVVFEASIPTAPAVSLSLNGPSVAGTLLERVPLPGSSGTLVNVYVFDLDDLGVAAGNQVSSIFLSPTGGGAVQLMAIAALNPGGTLPAIPLPAGGVLLLSGVGAFGLMRRRAQRA